MVEKNGKYGYIDSNGNFIIDPIYDEAYSFNGNYAIVRTTVKYDDLSSLEKDVYQLIDKYGEVKATTPFYDYPEYISKYNVWIINSELYDKNLNSK